MKKTLLRRPKGVGLKRFHSPVKGLITQRWAHNCERKEKRSRERKVIDTIDLQLREVKAKRWADSVKVYLSVIEEPAVGEGK